MFTAKSPSSDRFSSRSRVRSHPIIVGLTALLIVAGGTAVAHSAPTVKSPETQSRAMTQKQAATSSITTASSTLSDAVGFDIVAQGGMTAEVIPGVNPTFRFNNGWTSVTHIGIGHYCVNGGFVNGKSYDYPAVVSVTSRDTPGIGYVEFDSHGTDCAGVGVWARNLS
jgi:hypothetical protein